MHDETLVIRHPAKDIPELEFFDNRTQTFVKMPARHVDAVHLQLRHSLMSIAKWESRWHESFVEKEQMTAEELLDYVRCMTINPQKNQDVYKNLTEEDFKEIMEYMADPMSAIDLRKKKKPKKHGRKKTETAESVYFAMINLGIPMDFEKWHFNRLSTLIDYCANNGGGGMAGATGKPKSQRELMEFYHAMNQANRKKYNSKG